MDGQGIRSPLSPLSDIEMDAEGRPIDLTMSADLSIIDGAGGWASSSMMVAPPATPFVRRTQDFDEKDMSTDDLETTLKSTMKVRDEHRSFIDDKNDQIVKGLRYCETNENVFFVAEHTIIKDQEWAIEDEISKMMKRLELLKKRETLADILKRYPSRKDEIEEKLNEVNAELDSLDDTVTEEVSKDETGLDSTKESTLLNRTQVSYIKIIHYQEPADEVVETTVTIDAQPIFEFDIPKLTAQHVAAIRSKKVEHVKMCSKEAQTEAPARKKSEDYSSQTPQLQMRDEKSQAKVLAHEMAMQTTKPRSGVDAPSQTSVQRNSTLEFTDSFSQTKEIQSLSKHQQTKTIDSGIDSAADHSDIEATPVQKAVIVNRVQQNVNAAPVKKTMDMACDPIVWPKSNYNTIETSSSSDSESDSNTTKPGEKVKKAAAAKMIKDKKDGKKVKTKSSGTNPEKLKKKDQSTKTTPKPTSSKTMQTEKVKNEKMVNKQVNTLFDSRSIAELKQKAEDLKRENEVLKTAALAQKLKKEERTSSSDEETKPSKVKIKRVPSKKKTTVEKRPLSTASMKSTDDLTRDPDSDSEQMKKLKEENERLIAENARLKKDRKASLSTSSSDSDAPVVFLESVDAPPAVQALPVQQHLVQSSGPPPPEASEEEGTQVDREMVKNAAILKNMKDREDEIEELKQNLAKTEAEKKVLEDKIFDAGEAQLNEEELKAEIARLTAENEALRKDIENDEKEEKRKNAFLLKELSDKNDEVNNFNDELKGLQDNFESEKAEKNDLIKQLEKDIQKKDDEIKELQDEVAGFNEDLEQERRNKAVLLKKLKDREDELENELNEALKDKDDQIGELEKLNNALVDANKELKSDNANNDDHKAAKILALKNLADKEKEIEKLNSQLQEIKEEKASLENDVEKLFLERNAAKEELEELANAHKDLMNELQHTANESNDHNLAKLAALKKIKELEAEKKELQDQCDTYAEQLDAASEMSEIDEKSLADAKHQNKLLNQTLDSVKSSVEDLKNASFQEDKETEEKIQALEDEKAEKIKVIKNLEETIESLEEQIEDLNGENKKSRDEKLKTLAKIKLLEDAQNEKDDLEDELEKCKANLTALEKKIKDQDEAIQDLEEELNNRTTEIVNLKQKVSELESELADGKGDQAKALLVAKELKDRKDEIEFLKEEIKNLKDENSQLAKNQESEDDRKKKLLVAKELAERKEEINKLNKELDELKKVQKPKTKDQSTKTLPKPISTKTMQTEKFKNKNMVNKSVNTLFDMKRVAEIKQMAEDLKQENAKLKETQQSEADRAKNILIAKELAELKQAKKNIKTKDQSTKTLPKPTSSKTMQTEKIKNEKMVNKSVNTLFDMKRVAEIKEMAEELKRENAKLKETQESEDDRAKKILIAKELAERKEEIKQQEKEIQKLTDENKDLSKQAEENKDNKAAKLLIAKELKDREDEIAQLKQALALEEQNAKNAGDPNTIKELEDEIAALEDERDRALAKIKGLEKDLEFSKVLEDEIDKKEKEILAKDEQIQAYEETIAENNKKLKDLLLLKKAADKVAETESANEALKTEISEIKEERDELKSELEDLRNTQDADSSAEGLAGKKPLTGSTKTLDSGIFDKTQTLEEIPLGSSTENIRAEPQMIIIQRLQLENERLIAERDSVGDIDTLKKEYQDEKAHLEEDLDVQQQKLTQLTGELQKLLQDKAGLEEDLELKNEDLQAVEEDLEDVKSKLKKVQSENEELVDDNENRLKELVALKALKDRSGTIDELEQERDELKREKAELEDEKAALEEDLETKFKEALVAHKTVEQLKLLNENGQEEIAKLNEAYQDLEAELREKDAEMEQIEEQLQNNKLEKAKTVAALKALKKSVENDDEESDSSEEESDIFIDANDESKTEEIIDDIKKVLIVKKNADKRKDIENLEEQIADLEDENDELKAQNQKLEEIRKKHKDEIEKLTEENEILHEDVQSRPSSIAMAPIVAQQQVQSTNPFLQTHSDIESSIQPDEPKNSTLLRELEDENERLMNEIQDLKAQLDLSRTEMKFITAEKSDSGSSSGDLAEENEKLRDEVKRLAALVAMYKGRDSDDEVDLRPAKRTDSVPDLLEADTQKNLKEGVLHELTNTQKKLKEEEDKRKDLERIVDKLNETIDGLQTPEAQQRLKDGALSELEREKKRRSEVENQLEQAKNEAELAKELKEGALAEVDRLNSSLISTKLEELEKSDSKSSSRQSTPIPSKKLDELELQTMENEVQLQALRPDASEIAKKSPEEQDKILQDLKNTLEQKARDIEELEQEIEELKDENKELKVEAYDAQNYKKKFKKAIDEKHAQGQDLEELTTLYDQLLLKNDELKQKLARCRNELELLQEPYDQKLLENAQNSNRRLSDSLLIPIPSPSGRMLKNNDEIFVDQEKLSQQKRDPVDDNALWNISKMKRDMRQLQAQLRELDDRNSTLENKQSRALEQTDILEGHLNKASREQSDLLNMSISSSNRSLDRINESMTDQMIRVRDEMRVTDDENNRLIYELDQLKRDHEETERDLRQARNKLVWQQKELEALREANAKPNVDDYDKLMSEYTSALDKIEKQGEMLEQASVSSKADDLQSHLDQSRAECDLYEEEIGELKKKISVLEDKLKSSGRHSPISELQDISLGDSLVEKLDNLEIKEDWTSEERLKLEMVNELRYIFSEPEIVREEVSGPSSLESSSSSGKKKKENIDVLKESKETIRLLQSALEKLADESSENKDVTSELKGLSDQSVRLTEQLKKRQDFIDRLVEKYKSSEEKVREFIRSTMRAILQREQDRVAQRVSQDESIASMTFDL